MFPHTVLSAPLIPLARAGDLADVRFASSLNSVGEPVWMLPKGQRKTAEQSTIERTRPLVGSAGLKSLLDAGETDLVVGWGAVVAHTPAVYLRVAQISGGLSGCMAGLFVKRGSMAFTDITAEQDRRARMEHLDAYSFLKGTRIPALHPDGVEGYVDQYGKSQRLSDNQIALEGRKADLGHWQELKDAVLAGSAEAFLFFGWEPYVSRLQEEILPGFVLVEMEWLGLYFAQQTEGANYSSLDLIVHRDNEDVTRWLAEQRANKKEGFFAQLQKYTAHIREVQLSGKNPGFGPPVLSTIAAYLQMDESQLVKTLRQFEFQVRYYD
jgi:hypothetical protein